jgi:invasion protein IalB
MRGLRWVPSTLLGVMMCGASVVLASQVWAGTEEVARASNSRQSIANPRLTQAPPATQPQTRQPTAAPAAPARQGPDAPRRVETTQYNSWSVTCEETVGGTAKRNCFANLRLVNQRQATVLNWEIGHDPEGHLMTAIHVAPAMAVKNGDQVEVGPIAIPYGVELKFGNGIVRRLSFVTCGPQQCVAQGVIDDAFLKEANASTNATLTIHTPAGAVPFETAINGIDKALASTR